MAQHQRNVRISTFLPERLAWLFGGEHALTTSVAGVAFRSTCSGRPDHLFDATWSDLDEHCGVLELHEHCVDLRLSLFLAVSFNGTTCGWWTNQDGVWLGEARVGLA